MPTAKLNALKIKIKIKIKTYTYTYKQNIHIKKERTGTSSVPITIRALTHVEQDTLHKLELNLDTELKH